ncbi:hypothetical protein EV379_0031 [Microterricola gilva]|uniref:DUF6916 domain-containing protein n=1 Tax=Microterricola gilva TaxID=393267 RepID=A0A4Q8AH82_9MICO|nr:hypothetical protein [Microterricola gilva]RZU63742.1 hypothetical protein EV379_0031 [Microterricola gilva]
MSQELPSHADFLRVVGDVFDAADSAGVRTPLTLITCSDELRSGGYSSFSLGFRGDDTVREQGIFELRHPGLGTLHLFLVPSRADAAGTEYTASFNSLEA